MGAPDRPDPTEAKLLGILEAIRSLTPPQRRRLMRRLRVSGLMVSDEYLSDRNRLRVAPALKAHQAPDPGSSWLPDELVQSSPADEATRDEAADDGMPEKTTNGVETPEAEPVRAEAAAEDSEGDKPEDKKLSLDGPIEIVYDGGTREGSEQTYGTYAIRWPGEPQESVQLRYGGQSSAEEAEYDTLIAALESVMQRLASLNIVADRANLDIRGESPIIIEQLTGQTEIDNPALRLRCDRVRYLLRKFGTWGLHRNVHESQEDEDA